MVEKMSQKKFDVFLRSQSSKEGYKLNKIEFIENILYTENVAIEFGECVFKTLRLRPSAQIKVNLINSTIDELIAEKPVHAYLMRCPKIVKSQFAGGSLFIREETNIPSLELKNGYSKLEINNSTINHFSALGVTISEGKFTNAKLKGPVEIEGKAQQISFSHDTEFGSGFTFDGTFDQLFISDCKFVRERTAVILKGSDLNNLILRRVDLSRINLYLIKTSNFGFKYDDVNFPEEVDSYRHPVATYHGISTLFRQLKKKFSSEEDHIKARIFASLELESYYQHLMVEKKESMLHHIPLVLSKHSNDFGRSWKKPLVGLILSTFVLFILIWLFIKPNWPTLSDLLMSGDYFSFMLPTHGADLFNKYCPVFSGTVASLDFVQRIISGFLIFQLIRAFRFHVAK